MGLSPNYNGCVPKQEFSSREKSESRMTDSIGSFDRRRFLAGTILAASLSVAGEGTAEAQGAVFCCGGDDPLGCIRRHNRDALVALIEAQMHSLYGPSLADDPCAASEEVLDFLAHLDRQYQETLCYGLVLINFHCLRTAGRRFSRLSVSERMTVLNQGESPAGSIRGLILPRRPELIRWDEKYLLHSAISILSMATRLVVTARQPARQFVGLTWSKHCRNPESLLHIEAPPYPDLTEEYDLCVIGSGAGGAVVAALAAEQGKRVLIVEEGNWISPDALVERVVDAEGKTNILPARGDVVLKNLYRKAGVQLANMNGIAGTPRPSLRELRTMRPQQTVGVLQASVVGGGPYINNAIHLEIAEGDWNRWQPFTPGGIDYPRLYERMQKIKRELGVNVQAAECGAGDRSWRFAEGCRAEGIQVEPLPVAMIGCSGCGSDNSVDPFGEHIGGLHRYHPKGPNSYLMRALKANAQVAYRMHAVQMEIECGADGRVRAAHLVADDLRGTPCCRSSQVCIKAKQFALAAGAIASTEILHRSASCRGLRIEGLGERFTGNVVSAMAAVYDKPVVRPDSPHPDPGVAQCFYVRAKKQQAGSDTVLVEPALENWFHYPDTMATSLPGWFHQFFSVVRGYASISMAGMVVPTRVRPQNRIAPDGSIHLEVDQEEFELLLKGIEKIGRIFLAAATPDNGVTLHLPTRAVLLDGCGRPVAIRSFEALAWAIQQIRCRGPAFLLLATAHPQGGNALGSVVDPATFRVQLADRRPIENLYAVDASIFPAGCGVNPQLTVHALASFAAEEMLAQSAQ